MFDLIKFLTEKVIGQISFEGIAKRRREDRLATIGSELMLLYMSLNGVVAVGERILDVLKTIADGPDQGYEKKYASWQLRPLLQTQAEQLVKVIASCHRLQSELGVIDEHGGRILSRLLDVKIGLLRNQIYELWPGLHNPAGTNHLLGRQSTSILRSFKEENIDKVFASDRYSRGSYEDTKRAWDSGVKIPLEEQIPSSLAQQFLRSGADENLQAITDSTQGLRKQIEKHFSITDILLKVGDSRGIIEDASDILWEASH